MAVLSFNNLGGGLRTDIDPMLLPANMTPRCANVVFERGTVQTRPGRRQHGDAPADGVVAMAAYHDPELDVDEETKLVVVGADGKLYVSDATGQTFSPGITMTDADGNDLVIDPTRRIRLAQFNRNMYLVDGASPVRKFFNIDTSSWQPTFYGSGDFGAAGPSGIARSSTGDLYVCDAANHRILRYNSSGVLQGWYGSSTADGEGYHATTVTDPVSSSDDGGFNAPQGIDVGSGYIIVADGGNNRIQRVDTDGTHRWTATQYGTGTVYNLSAPRAVAISGSVVYTADRQRSRSTAPQSLVAYNASTGAYIGRHTLAYSEESPHRGSVAALAVDGDGKLYVAVYYYTALGGNNYLERYAESSGTFTREVQWSRAVVTGFENSTSGLYVSGTTLYAIGSGAIDSYTFGGDPLTATTDARVFRSDVSDMVIDGDDKWLVTHPQDGTIETSEIVAGIDNAVVSLEEMNSPTIAPTVTVTSSGSLTAATYDLCYTYARRVTSGSGDYEESQPSPAVTFALSTAGGVTGSITIDAGADLDPNNDKLYLYLRGGIFPEFARVHTVSNPTSGGTYTFTLTNIASEAPVLDPYVSKPPAGASIVQEWQGRMAYTQGDTLYLSQQDNPDRIAPLDLVNTPELYGLWVRIGTDGGEITGLGQIGSYLVVMKRRGVWLVGGDPGAATFAVQQISESHGCISHETIQQVAGAMLVWLDHNRVLAFDGQQFSDIGQYIAPNVRSYTEAEQQVAFAVYDPRNRWYQLTIPRLAAG